MLRRRSKSSEPTPPEKSKAVAYKKTKPRKAKKRKGWFKDLAEEVFDFVEDIFD